MKITFLSLLGLLLASTSPAFAQRTDDNAVTEAEDAFGKSVGDEQIGIYSADDVRGFSPASAGNLRIEGLFFDQQAFLTDRLIDGSTVHVGISAQGYPFPAPTGIADYALRKPGDKFIASVGTSYGPFGGTLAEVDFQIPIDGTRLGATAGAGIYREGNPFGGTPKIASYAASIRYKPSDSLEIQPFWSRINNRDDESQSLIFTTGPFLPNRAQRGRFFGQKWADFSALLQNYGVVAKAKPLDFDVALGVFRSTFAARKDSTDLLFETDRNGRVGRREVIIDRGSAYNSTSGELKVSRSVDEGDRRHTLHTSIRARKVDRSFGGSFTQSLGVSQIGVEDFRPEPTVTIGPKTKDVVHQTTFGIGYELRWLKRGELSVGLQKTRYSKQVTDPNPLFVIPKSKDSPWLYSVNAAINLTDAVTFYGGYVRGLEESDVAPSNAVNFNEAPPAIRTQQKDAGVRWKIRKGMNLVVGVFDVQKPYFNLDGGNRYRQLGQVRNRGVEFSFTGEVAPGLNVVAATIYLDAKVSGDEVARGRIGSRPIGTFRRDNLVSLNWKLPGQDALTLTARFDATSDRTANDAPLALDKLIIPARSVTSLGARYKFKVGDVPALLRFNVDNIFNVFGWNVGGSGFFVPNGSRRYSLSLSADL
jgi:iron complex outermembrane recepter protein